MAMNHDSKSLGTRTLKVPYWITGPKASDAFQCSWDKEQGREWMECRQVENSHHFPPLTEVYSLFCPLSVDGSMFQKD